MRREETATVELRKVRLRCLLDRVEFDVWGTRPDPDGHGREPLGAWTSSGDFAVAVLKQDPVWEEMFDLISMRKREHHFSTFGRQKVDRFVFDRLVDTAPNGERYEFGAPQCPNGHSADWLGFVEYPNVAGEIRTVRSLTHQGWDRMAEAERVAAVEQAITDFRSAEPELLRKFEQGAELAEQWRLRGSVSQGG